MRAVTLVDLVRVVGTVVAVVGAVLTAPTAFAVHVRRARAVGGAVADRVRRLIPWVGRSQGVTISAPTAQVFMTAHAGVVATGYVKASPDAPVDEQIAALWSLAEQTVRDVGAVRRHVDERAAQIDARVSELSDRLAADVAAVWTKMRKDEQRSVRINGYGLPVIAFGIVLTGLPDVWVRHAWVAWLLIVAAVAGTAYFSRRVYAEYRSA